jgi:hypothetical protein
MANQREQKWLGYVSTRHEQPHKIVFEPFQEKLEITEWLYSTGSWQRSPDSDVKGK